MIDSLTAYLNSLRCEVDNCGRRADHRQDGRTVCNAHLDPNVRAFATND
jgi:hypothetical protein